MSLVLPVYDPGAGRLRRLSRILLTTVTTDSTGKATVTIAEKPASVRLLCEIKDYDTHYSYTYDSATGTLTIYAYQHYVSPTTTPAVTGVTVATATAVTGVTPSTASAIASITKTTGTVVTGVTVSTTSAVTGVGTETWSVDTAGVLSHSHSLTTASVVTGVTISTATDLRDITWTTASVVTGVTVSTTSAVTGITVSTATVLTAANLTYEARAGYSFAVLVMW
jgi:hypothetical protein